MAGQDIIEWYDITFNSVHKRFAQTDGFIILIKKKKNTTKSQEFKVKSSDPWLVKTDITMFLCLIAGQLRPVRQAMINQWVCGDSAFRCAATRGRQRPFDV